MFTILIYILTIFLAVSVVKRYQKLPEVIIATLLLSLGILGFLPFILNEFFGVSYNFFSNAILRTGSVVSLAILTTYIIYTKSLIKVRGMFDQLAKLDRFLLLALLMLIVFGLSTPIRGWDAYSLYDVRGRFYSSGLKQSEMADFSKYDEANNLYYFSYPPMTSSIHAVLYSLDISSPTFIYPMFYAAIFLMIYVLVKKKTRNNLLLTALILIPALASRTFVGQIFSAYTNLPMIAFQLGCLYFALVFYKEGRLLDIFLSAIFLGFANWTRNLEPTFIAFVTFATIMVFNSVRKTRIFNKLLIMASYFAITVTPRLIWNNYLLNTVGQLSETSPSLTKLFDSVLSSLYLTNVIDVTFFIYKSLYPIIYYMILFALIIVFVFVLNIKVKKDSVIIYSIMLLILMILGIMFAGTLYFSVTFKWWNEIPGSFLRSNLILIPLIMLFSVYFWNNINNHDKEK